MKIKFAVIILITILTNRIKAQTVQDIVGAYSLRGGSHFLKPDQTFVIIGYSTIITRINLFDKEFNSS